MNGLAGTTALVTGATGLIGGAIARRLLEEGATVFAASRSRARAEAWVREARDRTGRLRPCELDLADAGSIAHGIDDVARDGVPTVFVAAASVRDDLRTPAADLEHRHFERLFGVDVAGHYLCAREIAARLDRRPASFVWLSSIYARVGVDHSLYPEGMAPTPVQYAAVKSAVLGLVAYLAAQWGGRAIRVNGVIAGGVAVPERQPGEFAVRYARKTMLGRLGAPEEIAAAVAFLASDEASYVTGSCLVVDGGFTRW